MSDTFTDLNDHVRLGGTLTGPTTPGGAAGGDLSGTYPDPDVSAIGGVAITGTPSNGQTLTATAADAAEWQTLAVTPGPAVVRGPFSFAFDTANLNTGVTIYTPTVGDLLLDAWIEVDTVFDGTTPFADLGSFSGITSGWFANSDWGGAIALTAADTANAGAGLLTGGAGSSTPSLNAAQNNSGARMAPSRFTAATAIKLVVSQTGLAGGTAVGGAAGAGRVYLITATPVAFS